MAKQKEEESEIDKSIAEIRNKMKLYDLNKFYIYYCHIINNKDVKLEKEHWYHKKYNKSIKDFILENIGKKEIIRISPPGLDYHENIDVYVYY